MSKKEQLAEQMLSQEKYKWLNALMLSKGDEKLLRAAIVEAMSLTDHLKEKFESAHSHGWGVRERYSGPDRHGYESMLPENWGEMDYEQREQWFFEQWWEKNKSELVLPTKEEDAASDFYCAEWNRVGFRCPEGQCEKCRKAENAPE